MSATQPMSPVAVGTWVTVPGSNGLALDLLVIWRGSPGWFIPSGQQSSSGGGTQHTYQTVETYGDIRLELSFDRRSRAVEIQGKRVELGKNNVILVDKVDGQAGIEIARMMSVSPDLPAPGSLGIYPFLGRFPEILSYLQCGVRLENPRFQGSIDAICAQIQGK